VQRILIIEVCDANAVPHCFLAQTIIFIEPFTLKIKNSVGKFMQFLNSSSAKHFASSNTNFL
jgi:hypothetical protein